MPKQGEITYPRALDGAGREHALRKPFSDPGCGRYLRDMGAVMDLLPAPPAPVLDLGAGTAWTSIFLAQRGYRVTAQDISPGMIELARQNQTRHNVQNLELIVQDYEQMDFNACFDCALFFDSLHHAEDETAALRAVHRALKPGGVCVTVEPGKGHATAASSRHAATHYGVTEKDMHPGRIIELAHAIGFRGFEVFERRQEPRLLAAGPCEKLPPAPRRLELAARFLAAGFRCLFHGKRKRDAEALGLTSATAFQDANLVRLRK
ncbi:MAG: class I SAM-dependent methyltransferase [Opitutaceae bacterium]